MQVCTTTSKLCADPAVRQELRPEHDGLHWARRPPSARRPRRAGHQRADGGASDHPAAGSGGGAGAGGSTGDGAAGRVDGAAVDVPSQPEVGIATSCPGTQLTLFSKVALGDANKYYTSGVGVRVADEMVIFNGYTGPDATDGGADAGDAGAAPTFVNRIDVQHFDLDGSAKGPATPLAVVEGDVSNRTGGVGVYINGATVAPTGEIAVIYVASNENLGGLYLKLLSADAATVTQTITLQSIGGTNYGHQAHVQWEDGQFVASWVSASSGFFLNFSKYDRSGNPTGSVPSIVTDPGSGGMANSQDLEQASVAVSGGIYAVAYSSADHYVPSLAFVNRDGNQAAPSVGLPYSMAGAPDWSRYVVVGATSKGFVTVYDGQVPANDAGVAPTPGIGGLATFATPGADGGVGTTVIIPGASPFNNQAGARSSSDLMGAGFAILTADGKANFMYFSDDGTKHLGPSQVIQQMNVVQASDEIHLMNYQGSFGISLFSNAESRTRMAVSGCPATVTN